MTLLTEALYGRRDPAMPRVLGPGFPLSPREEVRNATDAMLHRMGEPLRELAAMRPPGCRLEPGYAHNRLDRACPEQCAPEWLATVRAWHDTQVGGPHFDLTLAAVLWVSAGHAYGPVGYDAPTRTDRLAAEPRVAYVDGPAIDGLWRTFQLHIHDDATPADLRKLLDEIPSSRRSVAGQMHRPARAVYWRAQRATGATYAAISTAWSALVRAWADGSEPAPGHVNFGAYREWRQAITERQARKRSIDEGDLDADAVEKALATLGRVESA